MSKNRVAICGVGQSERFRTKLTCSLAGLVLVTANPAYQADELAYVLKQSRAVALFQVASYRGNPMAEIGRQAAAKVEQIQRTTDAETDKQLALTQARKRKEQAEIDRETAAIRLEQAKIDAQARQVAADAAAYEKKAILEADNALQQKLDAYVKAQQYWASAFSKRRVPTQVFGATGNGGAGTDGDVQAFMNIMTMKAAKDLSVDPGIAAQNRATQ